MGIDCIPDCTDSNAIQYYRLSDELKVINEYVFDFLINISPGLYALIAIITVVMVFFYMMFYIRRSMENASRGG